MGESKFCNAEKLRQNGADFWLSIILHKETFDRFQAIKWINLFGIGVSQFAEENSNNTSKLNSDRSM